MGGAWSNDQLNQLFIYSSTTGALIMYVTKDGLRYITSSRQYDMNANGFFVQPLPSDGSFLTMTTAGGTFGGIIYLQPVDSFAPGMTFTAAEIYVSRTEALVLPTETRPYMVLQSPTVNNLNSGQVICRGQKSSSASDDAYVEIVGTLAYTHLYDQRTSDAAAIASTTLVAVNSVTLPLAGTYSFDGLWNLTNSGAAGRPAFALGGTSTPSAWRWVSSATHYNTATGSQGSHSNGTTYLATGDNVVNSDWTTTAGWSGLTMKGTVTVSSPGTLDFMFATSGAVGQAINVKAGSMVTVELVSGF